MVNPYTPLVIFVLGVLFGFLFIKTWYYVACGALKLDGKQILFGYHFHHSLTAIIPIILIYWTEFSPIFLIGMAVGIIIEHRETYGGFYYITKEKYHHPKYKK